MYAYVLGMCISALCMYIVSFEYLANNIHVSGSICRCVYMHVFNDEQETGYLQWRFNIAK